MKMHDDCKYSFMRIKTTTEARYDALRFADTQIEVKSKCFMCGLNPKAIELFDEQPKCQYFKLKGKDRERI